MSYHPSLAARHPSVDDVSWAVFDYGFRYRCLKARGMEYESLFCAIMSSAHGHDFSPAGTWGAQGDLKCDGYLHSHRMIFAVYAPKDFETLSKAKRKVRGDHTGAHIHWAPHMDFWTLVHNCDPELPAPMLLLLKQLERAKPQAQVREWGIETLRAVLHGLTRAQLTAILGPVPDAADLVHVTQADVKRAVDDLAVLLDVAGTGALPIVDLREVPFAKVRLNRLSNAADALLNLGRRHSVRVHEYFEGHTDPDLADRVVATFRDKYVERRGAGDDPDKIFGDLTTFAGVNRSDPRVRIAGYAVVSYLFEACHIFERPAELPPANFDAAAN